MIQNVNDTNPLMVPYESTDKTTILGNLGAQASIIASGLLKGNGEGGVSAAEAGTDYALPANDISATLTTAGWTGDSAPYTQTLGGLTGITGSSKLDIGLDGSATDAEYSAAVEAQIRAATSGQGTVTFKAHGTKPGTALPVVIRRLG